MFTSLLDLITEKGRGIHAFAAVATEAYARAAAEPEHSAAFYFLAATSEQFVDLHDRQPLSSEALEANFATFRADIQALEAVADEPPAERLSVLNRIAKARLMEEA